MIKGLLKQQFDKTFSGLFLMYKYFGKFLFGNI